MANRNAKDVKRFVEDISKDVAKKAYDPTEYATKEYVDETFEKKADVVDVVANPELSGDEADLTGLLVGDTKYKVPQGSGGGSELGEVITIDSTNFEAYDTYFGTSIGGGLYRFGIIFNNKTTNEKYCIVCNTETNLEEIDWDDPDIFNICMGCVRGGDLVLKLGDNWFTKMGVVCLYTTSSSTDTKIQMLN